MFDWLPEQIARVEATREAQENGWMFVLRPPATKAALRQCEAALGLPLSPGYRAFLRRWNGASLFRTERQLRDGSLVTTAAEFGIQGTDTVPAFQHMVRRHWREGNNAVTALGIS